MEMNNKLNIFLSDEEQEEVIDIPLEQLIFYDEQPFEIYENTNRFHDLQNSIQDYGVINPIIVIPKDNKYQILSGRHRYLASKNINKKTIPSIIKKDLTEEEIKAYVVETNINQRSFNDMNLIEQAKTLKFKNDTYKKLKFNEEIKNSREKVANEFNLSSSKAYRIMKLNNLIDEFQEDVKEKKITIQVANILANFSEEEQEEILKKVKQENIKLTKKNLNLINNNEEINQEEYITLKFKVDELKNIFPEIKNKKQLKKEMLKILKEKQ